MFEPEQRRDSEDIEFDFFDDAPTREATERESRPRRRMPTRPPGGGAMPPQLRLAALVVGIVVLVALLIFWVSSCQSDTRGAYESYMGDVAQLTASSDRVGRDLGRAIATPGTKLADLQQKLDGLRGQQAQIVQQAQGLEPPGPLRDEQESLVEAMQLRVSGLAGLTQGFGRIGDTTGARESGRALAQQAQRFVASDVVYEDLFRARSVSVLREQDVTGVDVPDSSFLTAPELTLANTWTLLVRRLTESPKAGGLHGNQIEGVTVQPGGKGLSQSGENTVQASDKTAFAVTVRNSGDSLETGVQVTFTIAQDPQIKDQKTIDLIEPGRVKTVVFRDLGEVKFGTPVALRVNVIPVQGETNTGNNSAEYRVIFSFG